MTWNNQCCLGPIEISQSRQNCEVIPLPMLGKYIKIHYYMLPARQQLYFDIFYHPTLQIGECKYETATSPQCHQQVCNYDSELIDMSFMNMPSNNHL
jgi:hypothetical protein